MYKIFEGQHQTPDRSVLATFMSDFTSQLHELQSKLLTGGLYGGLYRDYSRGFFEAGYVKFLTIAHMDLA